jgi:hypothetical protein
MYLVNGAYLILKLSRPNATLALTLLFGLIRLFCFNTKTESFDVSNEPKHTEDQPKQFEREHLGIFLKI